jgi:folate-binding Fe-S cluster repair protein YgfZ
MDAANSCWAWQPETPARLEQPVWLLRLEGPDARRFLHGQSSQAIELAAPGSALATCLISPTARMRALAWVLVDAGGAWLVIEAGDPEAVRTGLDRVLFPADQVQLGPLQPALLITPLGDTTLPQAAGAPAAADAAHHRPPPGRQPVAGPGRARALAHPAGLARRPRRAQRQHQPL